MPFNWRGTTFIGVPTRGTGQPVVRGRTPCHWRGTTLIGNERDVNEQRVEAAG